MKILIIFILLFGTIFGQWNRYVTYYETRIFRINDGYTVPYDRFVNEGDTIFYEACHDTINPIYESPYTNFLWKIDTTWNDTSLWKDGTMFISTIVDYPTGSYEITLHEVAYLDSFWVTIDSVHQMILDSTTYGHCTNALYVSVDTSDVPLLINLSFFEVVLINGRVSLTWTTESELNNCGFNVYRKEHKGLKNKINDYPIPGEGNTSSRTTYGLMDTNVHPGSTYTYTLESVSCSGVYNIEGRVVIYVPMIYGIFLAQNYPNPFNNSTTIEYAIDEKSEVSLHLYDINGRSAQVFKKIQAAGTYTQIINANNIASGTYIYFLRVHNMRTMTIRILSKKMTVIK